MSSSAAFNTKYWYTVILLIERKRKNSDTIDRSFKREYGTQLAITPSTAATAIEKHYNALDMIVDNITIRLRNDHGQVLLQTQKDDMTDQLPIPYKVNSDLDETTPSYPESERYFDVFKFLTTKTPTYSVNPIFRVKDHMK